MNSQTMIDEVLNTRSTSIAIGAQIRVTDPHSIFFGENGKVTEHTKVDGIVGVQMYTFINKLLYRAEETVYLHRLQFLVDNGH